MVFNCNSTVISKLQWPLKGVCLLWRANRSLSRTFVMWVVKETGLWSLWTYERSFIVIGKRQNAFDSTRTFSWDRLRLKRCCRILQVVQTGIQYSVVDTIRTCSLVTVQFQPPLHLTCRDRQAGAGDEGSTSII
ncbi:hypothetical protein ILYODFUR_012372 [Ilyodon furcidens]|uniref:Uncharacterized protein n=1 Tax=Ilyodon furcidens TaxID=33524 RepID=A0ABV0VDD3_9TELE